MILIPQRHAQHFQNMRFGCDGQRPRERNKLPAAVKELIRHCFRQTKKAPVSRHTCGPSAHSPHRKSKRECAIQCTMQDKRDEQKDKKGKPKEGRLNTNESTLP